MFEERRPGHGLRENASATVQAGPDVLFGERLRVRRPEHGLPERQRFGVRLRRPAALGDDDERPGLKSSCSIPEWKRGRPRAWGLAAICYREISLRRMAHAVAPAAVGLPSAAALGAGAPVRA